MGGILQSIDVDVRLSGGQIEFPDEISVTDCTVSRVFGGGGSEATVEVIFEEELSKAQIAGLRRSVRGATPRKRFDDVENYVEPDVENPRETTTFEDLKQALSENEIETDVSTTGVPPEDVDRPAHNGWIIDATISRVQTDTRYRTLGSWLDAIEKRKSANRDKSERNVLAEFATYNDASSTEQSVFDNEESLYQQATIRKLTTTEQLVTIKQLADDFISQRVSAFDSGTLQAQEERTARISDLDEQGGGDTGNDPDGLIDQNEIFKDDPIKIEIDTIVTEIEQSDNTQYNDRIFTGTVTKVTETNERVVRFEAIDARYQLNNFVVSIDIGSNSKPVGREEIVKRILGGKAVFGGESNDDLNATVVGEDSGIPGIVSAEPIEELDDPAADLKLEDLLSGISTENIDGANSETLTWGGLIDLDTVTDNGYPERKYRQLVDAIKGTDRVLTFLEYDRDQRERVARRTDGGILSEYSSPLDDEDVTRMQETLQSIVDVIRPVGPNEWQSKVNEQEQRRKNQKEAIDESIARFKVPYKDDNGINGGRSWGVDYYETAYQVIQEMAFNGDAMLHIDEHNVIHFAKEGNIPHDTWTSDGSGKTKKLPPVIKWESGDEKTEEDVIVESKYDETALGAFHPTSTKEVKQEEGHRFSEGLRNMAVSSVSDVQNAKISTIIDRELMLDSGTITIAGHPRIHAWDRVELDENIVDGFASISAGTYTAKEVRHIVNDDDGYITEIELGKDPRSLYEQFVKDNLSVEDSDTAESDQDEESDKKGLLGEIADIGNELLDGDIAGAAEETDDILF